MSSRDDMGFGFGLGITPSSSPGAFSPLSLSPALWLKADAGTLKTVSGTAAADADPVGEWQDQSGNGRNVSITLTQRPLLKTNIQNGRPVVRFDGVNDVLRSSSFTAITQPVHVFIVFSQRTWADGPRIYDLGDNGCALFQNSSSPTLQSYSGALGPSTVGLATNTFGIVRTLYNGASSKIAVNGGAYSATSNVGSTSATQFTISGYGGSDAYSSAIDIAEMLVFAADKSANEAGLLSYLNQRWATY